MENVYSWAICLELAEFELDPSLIKTLMWTVGWVIPNVLMKEEEGRDKLFVFYPNFASSEGNNLGSPITFGVVEDVSEFNAERVRRPGRAVGDVQSEPHEARR
jgi:hypothetical protein